MDLEAELEFDFEFDKWADLANRDLDAFEELRSSIIEQVIDATCLERDSRRALEGLQFRIDMERRKSKTAMESCIRLSSMMQEQFFSSFHPTIKSFHEVEYPLKSPVATATKATVIPLRRPEEMADKD